MMSGINLKNLSTLHRNPIFLFLFSFFFFLYTACLYISTRSGIFLFLVRVRDGFKNSKCVADWTFGCRFISHSVTFSSTWHCPARFSYNHFPENQIERRKVFGLQRKRGSKKQIKIQDHHCPWTSHCVGKNNIISFYIFILSTLFSICYLPLAFISSVK